MKHDRTDTMNTKLTRRSVIKRGIQVSLGGALTFGLSSCGSEGEKAAQTVCSDPETMSASEASMRSSLGYTPTSSDPAQNCAGCAYFKGGAGDCGTCDLLGGAQVNAMGRCNSWGASGD